METETKNMPDENKKIVDLKKKIEKFVPKRE